MTLSKLSIEQNNACLLVVDVQEKLSAVMNTKELEAVIKQIQNLIETAKILELPLFWAEQYPKGMGTTLSSLKDVFPKEAKAFEKKDFSCFAVDSFRADLEKSKRNQVIVCGMETHICVFQTARDLCFAGKEVFVATDAVISRKEDNKKMGLHLMEKAGATLSCTEAILFDLLKRAEGDSFKAIQRLIK